MKALALLLLLMCAPLWASPGVGPVDSSASGVYLGDSRVCRVVLSRYQAQWVQVDLRCTTFAGAQSASLSTVWAPNVCPQGGAYSLTPWAPNEYLSLRWFNAIDSTLGVVLGVNQSAVMGGIGTAETWYRIGNAPSSSPYACARSSRLGR
jgi:hypothetical protein